MSKDDNTLLSSLTVNTLDTVYSGAGIDTVCYEMTLATIH